MRRMKHFEALHHWVQEKRTAQRKFETIRFIYSFKNSDLNYLKTRHIQTITIPVGVLPTLVVREGL